jgi:hypothetical protein
LFIAPNGELKELGWLHFTDLQDMLKKVNNAGLTHAISILLNRQYASHTYKEITMSSLTHHGDQYTIPTEYANDYQDISLIEKEHDVWMQFLMATSKD